MNVIKRFIGIFIVTVFIILGMIPSFSYAELNDEVRAAIVKCTVDLIAKNEATRCAKIFTGS